MVFFGDQQGAIPGICAYSCVSRKILAQGDGNIDRRPTGIRSPLFKQKLQYSGVDKDFARHLRLSNPTASDGEIETAFIEEIRVLSLRDFGEEILLEPGIVKDEPRRASAKLFLNSLWVGGPMSESILMEHLYFCQFVQGKLAQRTRLPMVSVFDNADDVFALIENGQWDFTSIAFGYTHSKNSPTIDDLEEIRQEQLTALV